jgi:hypothetical protein
MSFETGLLTNIKSILDKDWSKIPLSNSRRMAAPFPAPPLGLIFNQLEANLSTTKDIFRSPENWRFTVETYFNEKTTSTEKRLEKLFARHLEETKTWANQVPTCSGFSDGRDGKRSIDLVQDLGEGRFKFYELKTVSNSPTYATVEVLLYGLIYLLARKRCAILAKTPTRLLEAKEVQLIVLAPEGEFYSGYPEGSLSELEHVVNTAIGEFAINREPGLRMTFSFEVLGPGFQAQQMNYSSAEIELMASGIKRLFAPR